MSARDARDGSVEVRPCVWSGMDSVWFFVPGMWWEVLAWMPFPDAYAPPPERPR